MRLEEIKNLLADCIRTYSITVEKEDAGKKILCEYNLEVSKTEPEKKLLYAIFPEKDEIYNILSKKKVKAIFVTESGFGIELIDATPQEFEELSKKFNVPLTVENSILD